MVTGGEGRWTVEDGVEVGGGAKLGEVGDEGDRVNGYTVVVVAVMGRM